VEHEGDVVPVMQNAFRKTGLDVSDSSIAASQCNDVAAQSNDTSDHKRIKVKRKLKEDDALVSAALNVSTAIQNFAAARSVGPSVNDDEFDYFGRFVPAKLRRMGTDEAAVIQSDVTRLMQLATTGQSWAIMQVAATEASWPTTHTVADEDDVSLYTVEVS
jgi:hypothetical protein